MSTCPEPKVIAVRSAPGPLGWHTTIHVEGLQPVNVDARDQESADKAAFAALQELVDASDRVGKPINPNDYAVEMNFAPEESPAMSHCPMPVPERQVDKSLEKTRFPTRRPPKPPSTALKSAGTDLVEQRLAEKEVGHGE